MRELQVKLVAIPPPVTPGFQGKPMEGRVALALPARLRPTRGVLKLWTVALAPPILLKLLLTPWGGTRSSNRWVHLHAKRLT